MPKTASVQLNAVLSDRPAAKSCSQFLLVLTILGWKFKNRSEIGMFFRKVGPL